MRRVLSIILYLISISPAAAVEPDARDVEFFERKIRPVLVQQCYSCHSPKAKTVQGGLLLDSRAGLRKGGDSGPAVVPGKPADSVLLAAIKHESFEMPPKGKLPDGVIADFERWIKMGAPDPRVAAATAKTGPRRAGKDFWSFQPVRRTAAPEVRDKSWPAGDIDRLILARLEAKELSPGPDVDRRTLVRRVYFDLIGLPPSPEEIKSFLADETPAALARLIDRLLASRQFAERWGRHWLDVARFAESSGGGRTRVFPDAWRYRQYVIDSLHRDKPFNEFVAEQIAGDLLPSGSPRQRRERLTALGFLMLGPINYELQDKELLRMEVIDEQIDTMGRAFLGMTIGCARCHDHKFDPIPTADYYALAGIFRSTKSLVPGNVSGFVERRLPGSQEQERELARHEGEVRRRQQQVDSAKKDLAALEKQLPGSGKLNLTNLPGLVVDDAQAKLVGQWQSSRSVPGFIGENYLHDGNAGDGNKSATYIAGLPMAGRYEVRISYTPSTNRAARAPVTVHFRGGQKTVRVDQRKKPPIGGVFASLGTFSFEQGGGRVVIGNQDAAGHVIADAVQFLPLDGVASTTGKANTGRDQTARVRREIAAARAELKKMEKELAGLKKKAPPAEMAMAVEDEKQPGDFFICIRGNVRNLGQKVPRGFLSVASPGPAKIAAGRSGRLELARWLADADNPLTSRVMVNRVWHHLFGAGLVRTVDNFGSMGEPSSHPLLLDYLAARFVESGWSVKKIIRQIMLSRVYRLSSDLPTGGGAADPENRLLSRQNRRRLEAEAIRDAILLVSGQLEQASGGPTIKPGTNSEFGYRFDSRRRSVYVPVFRNTLHPLLEVFDFADPNLVSGRRNTSTLATQALYLMNSPFVAEQSRRAAARLLGQDDLNDAGRLKLAYQWTLGRPPSKAEAELAAQYLAGFEDQDDNGLLAWSTIFQSLFASIDFRYVD